ncbi:MAG: hypothetical protein SGARI_000748 [Bacillariaceae sp.]
MAHSFMFILWLGDWVVLLFAVSVVFTFGGAIICCVPLFQQFLGLKGSTRYAHIRDRSSFVWWRGILCEFIIMVPFGWVHESSCRYCASEWLAIVG